MEKASELKINICIANSPEFLNKPGTGEGLSDRQTLTRKVPLNNIPYFINFGSFPCLVLGAQISPPYFEFFVF